MKKVILISVLVFLSSSIVFSHETTGSVDVDLHVDASLDNCNIIFHESLTQSQFERFVKEGSDFTYFTSLSSAQTLGKYNFEISLVQGGYQIDEKSGAWNNTFHHPDEEHYLLGGNAMLKMPSIRAKMGLREDLDIGVFYTEDPRANYGFMGFEAKYAIDYDNIFDLDFALRGTYGRMIYVDDVTLNSYSIDFLMSKEFFNSLNPYLGISANAKYGVESAKVVDLDNHFALVPRYTAGVNYEVYIFSIAAEASYANILTASLRLGFNF